MIQATLEELFSSPWGILSSRRGEVESGGYGVHERIMREEIDKQFRPIDAVAEAMGCHRGTATKRLYDAEVRFIEVVNRKRLYFVADLQPVIDRYQADARQRAERTAGVA